MDGAAARSRARPDDLDTGRHARWVYDFSEGSRDMCGLLGGKGANLAEMTRVLGAQLVPAGFTITTAACLEYVRSQREPEGLIEQVDAALQRLEQRSGKRFGDPDDPLLVSVRSGARESMPGMLDTILNVGLNDRSVCGLASKTANERFAWDSYRRLIEMFGEVVHKVPGKRFAVRTDQSLPAEAIKRMVARSRGLYAFPQDPREQLFAAIRAVFESWMGKRAVHYRRIHHIADDWGTAVNVQQMVFGNRGEQSGSGVAFSRDEVTGAPAPSGDFLLGAQGEDVVAGIRTPRDLAELAGIMPAVHAQLIRVLRVLEAHYEDMQDVEFTVEEGRLYLLQTRAAKRPAQAAVRFAVDAVDEGLLTREQALTRVDAERLGALLHPTFARGDDYRVLALGVPASPGAACGQIAFTAKAALAGAAQGHSVILVRTFTEATDVEGFHAARGILTAEGGKASHAALIARGMGVPAVTGAAISVDVEAGELIVGGRMFREGEEIAIDGDEGAVVEPGATLVEPSRHECFERLLAWADEVRRIGVRANADTPSAAAQARALGAEGIGLCRTEHMFMSAERQPAMRSMLMAEDEHGRRQALRELLPFQEADFAGIFRAMRGLPVTIRLLDPPLHEFLPDLAGLRAEVERARIERAAELPELERVLGRVEELHEDNPMLGTRGCRLGILYPELYEMQVAAVVRAAMAVRPRPRPEIMIPLIVYERELEELRELIVRVAFEHGFVEGLDYTVGTMIELPRACFVADRIARHADFFSFGTNDLTQTGLGLSRDDVESKFMPTYIEREIVTRSPFETIDTAGVGGLVRLGASAGREANPALKLGACGEHAGDPDSIAFFHEAGLDYVSCSPPRIPIARIAAAQAAISAA